jgi:hypothetical protein
LWTKNFASQKSWYQDSFMEREEEAVVCETSILPVNPYVHGM